MNDKPMYCLLKPQELKVNSISFYIICIAPKSYGKVVEVIKDYRNVIKANMSAIVLKTDSPEPTQTNKVPNEAAKLMVRLDAMVRNVP